MDLETVEQSGKGPGAILVDVDPITPANIIAIVNGTASGTTGRHIGGLTDTPTYTESDEVVDRTENIVGLNARIVGSHDVQMTSVKLAFEIAKMTIENFKLIRPNYQITDWLGSSIKATLTIGTGASGVVYTAQKGGADGNSIRVVHVAAAAASAPTTVAVSGNDVTVTLGTGATAGTPTATASQVATVVNASAAASALVSASLSGDGTGTAAAQALTALAGGASGPKVGSKLQRVGPILPSHHLKNVTLVVPRPDTPTGFLYVVENAINIADDHEYQPDENGVITGVGVEMEGFSLAIEMNMTTGDFGTPSGVYLLDPVAQV